MRIRETAVVPLRTIRTRLKLLPEFPFVSSVVTLMQEVKRLEQMAEKIEASTIADLLTKYQVSNAPITEEELKLRSQPFPSLGAVGSRPTKLLR